MDRFHVETEADPGVLAAACCTTLASMGCTVSFWRRGVVSETLRDQAVHWLCRSFGAPTSDIREAYVELAVIYEALAGLAERLDRLSSGAHPS